MHVVALLIIHLSILGFPDAEKHIRRSIRDIVNGKHRLDFYSTIDRTAPRPQSTPARDNSRPLAREAALHQPLNVLQEISRWVYPQSKPSLLWIVLQV